MSFAERSAGSSSPDAPALGEVLAFFGSVADHAAGNGPGEGERVASAACGMARLAGLDDREYGALYFAARLRNAGAFGNAGFAKGDPLSDRAAMFARWDIPAQGARICETIAALPKESADLIRWQAECWDGTGYPDQLRWSGIPKSAQLLHIAQRFANAADPDEAFSGISAQSGRSFAPEQTRIFTMWFHTTGGETDLPAIPFEALEAAATTPRDVLLLLSEHVDHHNATRGRAQRIARRVEEIGRVLELDDASLNELSLASLLFGIGELRAASLESAQFDPLARLGIETRAAHALRAAGLIEQCPLVADAAPIVRSRAEWYDGTGAPDGLRHNDIPFGANILAVAIASDAIDRTHRIETASGTQFNPDCVKALAEVLKTHA